MWSASYPPRDITDAGCLWAATACDIVQEQVTSSACGSVVVDSVHPEPLETMALPKASDDGSGKALAA